MPYILRFFFFLVLVASPTVSWSYPQFIGYKYSSCLTCHFNGNGNGPLNDYGRALWAAEIAGRLWSSKTDEQLGASSGFFGSKELPWWIRPGIKTRQLNYQVNPGGPDQDSRAILMQAEVNAAVLMDKTQKNIFVASYGYAPVPFKYKGQAKAEDVDEWISREHYFRTQVKREMWFYIGMFDKPFGIRHVNHTAYSRAKVGVAQNDQAHGVLAQIVKPNWEFSVNAYMGNLFQSSDVRQRGVSMMYENEVKPAWRVGGSLMHQANEYIQSQRVAGHSRYGFGYGSALMFELGILQDTPKDFSQRRGYYLYSEAMQKLVRGYHLFFTGQAFKDRMERGRQNNLRFGAGFLMFPMQRVEFRVEVENNRQLSSFAEVQQDSWAVLSQFHMSL